MESVQKRATKKVRSSSSPVSQEILIGVELFSLEKTAKYSAGNKTSLYGQHELKMHQGMFSLGVRKYFLTIRAVRCTRAWLACSECAVSIVDVLNR